MLFFKQVAKLQNLFRNSMVLIRKNNRWFLLGHLQIYALGRNLPDELLKR